ncbi:COP9 signalosome [Lactifluus subvellereus]|nr:COP9 signalosome [Lactifluus subvellereus]
MPELPVSVGIVIDLPTPEAQTPLPQSSYFQLFAQIAALQTKGDYYGLIQAAERADLDVSYDAHPARLLITMPLVLSYLIVNDLPPAKFALMRLPDTVASLPLAQAVLNLFASVWERRYEHVYPRGDALFNLARQTDFSQAEVGGVLTSLVTTFTESFRQRTFALLSKAYTTIPLTLAQVYLGLPSDELLPIASRRGWHFDATTYTLTPACAARRTHVTLSVSPTT